MLVVCRVLGIISCSSFNHVTKAFKMIEVDLYDDEMRHPNRKA